MRILSFMVSCSILFCAHMSTDPFNKIIITGVAQGTTYHITYYAEDSSITKKQVDSILDTIDSSLSLYKPYSLISTFNASATGIIMDGYFKPVISKSLETWQATNGISDITVQPLVQAWGFGAKKIDSLPNKMIIKSIKKCVGLNFLKIKGDSLVKLKPCVTIDVNGIAQGYSVDVLAAFLEAHGINNYLVELGGEIRIKGRKQPGNEKMKIGIESPGEDEFVTSLQQQVIEVDKGAVTTSGSYRKFYESKGKKIIHIIDPKTGYPAQTDIISVTVYARDAITADAFDNALLAMGLQKALQFTERRKDISAYFIYRKKNGAIADTASRQFYKLLYN